MNWRKCPLNFSTRSTLPNGSPPWFFQSSTAWSTPTRISGYDSARMLTKMADICCCGVRCGNVWTGGKSNISGQQLALSRASMPINIPIQFWHHIWCIEFISCSKHKLEIQSVIIVHLGNQTKSHCICSICLTKTVTLQVILITFVFTVIFNNINSCLTCCVD